MPKPKIPPHVELTERSLDSLPSGFSQRCRVCRAEPCVYRVQVWRSIDGPKHVPSWRVRDYYYCADHKAQAEKRRARVGGAEAGGPEAAAPGH